MCRGAHSHTAALEKGDSMTVTGYHRTVTGYHRKIYLVEECDLTVHPPGAIRWLDFSADIHWAGQMKDRQ